VGVHQTTDGNKSPPSTFHKYNVKFYKIILKPKVKAKKPKKGTVEHLFWLGEQYRKSLKEKYII
jgi:hypothetical protein